MTNNVGPIYHYARLGPDVLEWDGPDDERWNEVFGFAFTDPQVVVAWVKGLGGENVVLRKTSRLEAALIDVICPPPNLFEALDHVRNTPTTVYVDGRGYPIGRSSK